MSCQRKNDIRGTDMNEGKHLGELSMNMNDHGNTHAKVNKSHNVLLPLNNSSSQLSCSPGGLSSSGALGLVSLTHPASCFPWDQSVSRWPPPMAQGPGASSQFFLPYFPTRIITFVSPIQFDLAFSLPLSLNPESVQTELCRIVVVKPDYWLRPQHCYCRLICLSCLICTVITSRL